MKDTLRQIMLSSAAILMASLAAVAATPAPREQLRTLGEAATPRFKITDRVWPDQPGATDICLWRDDKLCAFSVTIDDNMAPDHDWWLEQGKRYGWPFTWFVITGRVDGPNAFFGKWQGFERLRAAGHDVQSHTVTHLHFDQGISDIESEYRLSAAAIETNLPGVRACVLAYPGGPMSATNDPAVAARYYVAARGGAGTINPANQINYLRTCSVGGLRIGDEKPMWSDFLNLFDPKRYRDFCYRGWYCCHFHGVKPETRAATVASFDQIKAREADVWVGLFREVVLYAQERDTAKLSVTTGADGALHLLVTDRMDDQLFDYPLTVKVRLPDDWKQVTAVQDQKAVRAVLCEHGGARYALVDVIPDRGEVVVRR
jgi:hypothetical protein